MKKFKMAWSRSEKKHRNAIEKETEFGFEVESLESRQMLAGNVDVVVKADNSLVITGDNADNDISVLASLGSIMVVGNDGETVTNGGSTGIPSHDLNKLTINMKGGDDRVTVEPHTAAGKVRITGAAGDDFLCFEGTAQDRVQIIGGGGNDSINVSGRFNDKVTLNGGAGRDFIQLYLGLFNDKVTLSGGAGDDNATISAATFATDVKANMGHGSDVVRLTDGVNFADARFNLGSGDDLLVMVAMITGDPIFNGGGGFDTTNPDPDTIASCYPNVTLKSFEGRQ